MTDRALVLTPDQTRAFRRLKRAFDACEKSGLEIHAELTSLYAINSHELAGRGVVSGEVDRDLAVITNDAETFRPRCFIDCAGDDGLSFREVGNP